MNEDTRRVHISDSGMHPAADNPPLSTAVNQLILLMEAVTEQYSTNVREAIQELTDRVHAVIQNASTTKDIPMTRYQIKTAQSEFDAKILTATGKLDSHRQWFVDEFCNLESHLSRNRLYKSAMGIGAASN